MYLKTNKVKIFIRINELTNNYILDEWFSNASQNSYARRKWGITMVPPTRVAIPIASIISSFVTPPDVVSQVIVSIPMMIIYELSIYISVFVNKNKLKNG